MKQIRIVLIIGILFAGCNEKTSIKAVDLALIPQPQQLELGNDSYIIDKDLRVYAASEFQMASNFLRNFIANGTGIHWTESTKDDAQLKIIKDTSLPAEGYSLAISKNGITIKAADPGGAYYAVQTLRQLLPVQLESDTNPFTQAISIPHLYIEDAPKFKYRGMHLDVGRHFFPKEFIKEYIANMSLLKMNYFHWHLTEDQGWRIEIKQFPKLTTHAAFRNETLVGHYNTDPQVFDGERYGGYYSQEDIKDIVAFATAHNVTIIPEIEMPGHAQAAISAYPELGCTGKNVEVATKWGVFENIYCPNQKTFSFLKDVLSEVMELFPGEYIHIGGDEAPKAQWEKCNHCQQLIKEHDLKDEHGLQSYFIKEIEAFINSKGKKMIGWDEILEGGLAPNATVMSWRGIEGGIEAAKQQHDVIMTPTSHAYFDYYQADHPDEPLAIGGFLPLKKVFSFNPVPDALSPEESRYILGAQGNVWTEYMPNANKVEYMAYPRMLAMSEVVWRGASENVEEDYGHFLARLESFLDRLDVLNVNYAIHIYDLEGRVIKKNGLAYFELITPTEGNEIRYAKKFEPELYSYTSPIPFTESTVIGARVHKNDTAVGRELFTELTYHKGIPASVTLNVEPHSAYNAGGKEALINGIKGSNTRFGDKEWLGFWGDDLEITIDLGAETTVNSVKTRFYNANGQWVYAPKEVLLFTSKTGEAYAFTEKIQLDNREAIVDAPINTIPTSARFIKLRVPSYGIIPDGLQGAGNKGWTFIDEIIIE